MALFTRGRARSEDGSAPRWIRLTHAQRIERSDDLILELFVTAFAGTSARLELVNALWRCWDEAENPTAFARGSAPVLRELQPRASLPNYFFIVCARDVLDPHTLDLLTDFERHFDRLYKPRFKKLVRACIDEEPSFLHGWFAARGAMQSDDESRAEFFDAEYDLGVQLVDVTEERLPLPGHTPIQIVPKISALLLAFNAHERDRWRDVERAPRVSARLELGNAPDDVRIRKFVKDEAAGDPAPHILYLIDSEPDWWFTIGVEPWDDVYVPGLPCSAELRVAIRPNPGSSLPAHVTVEPPKLFPRDASAITVERSAGPVAYRLRIKVPSDAESTSAAVPDSDRPSAVSPFSLDIVTLARAFAVRDLLTSQPLFNPVLRLVARLLPWPVGHGAGFGRSIAGLEARFPHAQSLNWVDEFVALGLADLKSLVFGIDQENRAFLEVARANYPNVLQLLRDGAARPVGSGPTYLRDEDRVRVVTPQGTVDLVWRDTVSGRFLSDLGDVFAGGFLIDRIERSDQLFVQTLAYEPLDAAEEPGDARSCWLIFRGRDAALPRWPRDAHRRVTQAFALGDPYLSADGAFSISPVLHAGGFKVALTAAPNAGSIETTRTFFRAMDSRWHAWVREASPGDGARGGWPLSRAQDQWSSYKKTQQFIVGSSLFNITLSGTV